MLDVAAAEIGLDHPGIAGDLARRAAGDLAPLGPKACTSNLYRPAGKFENLVSISLVAAQGESDPLSRNW